jgi:hypothetical protein
MASLCIPTGIDRPATRRSRWQRPTSSARRNRLAATNTETTNTETTDVGTTDDGGGSLGVHRSVDRSGESVLVEVTGRQRRGLNLCEPAL